MGSIIKKCVKSMEFTDEKENGQAEAVQKTAKPAL